MQERLPLPSAARQITRLARKLKLSDVTADCFPAFDLPSVLVGHSSPHAYGKRFVSSKGEGSLYGPAGKGQFSSTQSLGGSAELRFEPGGLPVRVTTPLH
jgi:hypothetical protein